MPRRIFIAWLIELLAGLMDKEWDSFEREEYWAHGGVQQRDRLERVADWCAISFSGDLLEIGCHAGGTTLRLAQIARRYGRRVLAIDPWQPGTQNCRGGEYELFLKNTREYQDIIDIVRLPSQHEQARMAAQERELCFAFVDGLHTHEAALSDILSVAHAPIVAVDDVLWNAGVRSALVCGGREIGHTPVHLILCREGYLFLDDAIGRCTPGQPE